MITGWAREKMVKQIREVGEKCVLSWGGVYSHGLKSMPIRLTLTASFKISFLYFI